MVWNRIADTLGQKPIRFYYTLYNFLPNLADGLTLFRVQNEGMVTSNDELKTFNQLLTNHNKIDPEGVKNVQARAIYDMSHGTVGSETISDEDLSSLKLRFLWSKPRSLLETPPGYANIELLAKLSFYDDRLACCNMFEEIELLQGYKSGLENQGELFVHKSTNLNNIGCRGFFNLCYEPVMIVQFLC